MYNISLSEDILDEHLHQLRTALSVIDISAQKLASIHPNDLSLNLISSSVRLIENSYENILFLTNFELILEQKSEELDILDVLKNRLKLYEQCFDAYDLNFVILENANPSKFLNETILERIFDNIIVFFIKNCKQKSSIVIEIANNKVLLAGVPNNLSAKFKTTVDKLFDTVSQATSVSATLINTSSNSLRVEVGF